MRSRGWASWMLLFMVSSCEVKTELAQPIPAPGNAFFTAAIPTGNLDLEKSVIYWKGTKLGKTRHHEGVLKLKAGNLELADGNIQNGSFLAEMSTLQVTDIPVHERQARANLIRHLKSDFDVQAFPYSQFRVTAVSPLGSAQQVCGDLQIRDVVQRICFEPHSNGNAYTANLTLNRSDWGIGAEGSWLENRLVDDTFYLKVVLYVKQQ